MPLEEQPKFYSLTAPALLVTPPFRPLASPAPPRAAAGAARAAVAIGGGGTDYGTVFIPLVEVLMSIMKL